jgi:predicted ATPase
VRAAAVPRARFFVADPPGGGLDRRRDWVLASGLFYLRDERFLEAMAEQRPLVVVFEDLHWADESLLDFVDELVDWVTEVPLLVVATARPELLERRPGWAGGKLNATTLALAPLSDDQTARLIAASKSVVPRESGRRDSER